MAKRRQRRGMQPQGRGESAQKPNERGERNAAARCENCDHAMDARGRVWVQEHAKDTLQSQEVIDVLQCGCASSIYHGKRVDAAGWCSNHPDAFVPKPAPRQRAATLREAEDDAGEEG